MSDIWDELFGVLSGTGKDMAGIERGALSAAIARGRALERVAEATLGVWNAALIHASPYEMGHDGVRVAKLRDALEELRKNESVPRAEGLK